MFPLVSHYRIAIYSHDTFGLGHLRRCRRLANAFVESYRNVSVLILSGSPVIGCFDFNPRVDFVRIPGISKKSDGAYEPHHLGLSLQEVLDIRSDILLKTVQSFKPHLFLVDKEPWGLKGELTSTLYWLKSEGTLSVLGLRDVLDDPQILKKEWAHKKALTALEQIYDQIWVYGPQSFYHPLTGLDIPSALHQKMVFTGYLCNPYKKKPLKPCFSRKIDLRQPFILATTGGGGDGEQVIRALLKTYQKYGESLWPLLIVSGPFMDESLRQEMIHISRALDHVDIIEFEKELEDYMHCAKAIVAMGGYNTFCEMLEMDKPALLIPRSFPRKEQLIRAQKAAELGLFSYILSEDALCPEKLYKALEKLKHQSPPSHAVSLKEIACGLEHIQEDLKEFLPCLEPHYTQKAVS